MPLSKESSAKLNSLDRSVQLCLTVLREVYPRRVPYGAFDKAMELAWLYHDSHKYETYVKHRVKEALYELKRLHR